MTQPLDKKYPGRAVRREGDQIFVTIPVKFYHRNGRQMVQAKTGERSAASPSEPVSNATLVAALAKAWAWQEELETGIAASCYRTLEDFASE